MRDDKQERREGDPEPASFDKVDVENVSFLGEVRGCGGGWVIGLVETAISI